MNIFGKLENLELYHKNGKQAYHFYLNSIGDYWTEQTFNENLDTLTYKNSDGYSYEYTRDKNGRPLTYKDSDGHWHKYTRDENGNELTYEDARGEKRGFDVPEFTMEELVAKLGNFKIKK